ncbi:hypothetical protein INR49_001705 [Caranx melampygus]|nr:hypothetical protein INR49_001705 [Caranx melampygus]
MSHRLTKEELDEQFELFLKEMTLWNWAGLRTRPVPKAVLRKQLQNLQCHGLLSSGKSFRKSLRKSHPIQEEDEDPGEVAVLSRDNTQTEGESTVHQGVVLIGKVCLHV